MKIKESIKEIFSLMIVHYTQMGITPIIGIIVAFFVSIQNEFTSLEKFLLIMVIIILTVIIIYVLYQRIKGKNIISLLFVLIIGVIIFLPIGILFLRSDRMKNQNEELTKNKIAVQSDKPQAIKPRSDSVISIKQKTNKTRSDTVQLKNQQSNRQSESDHQIEYDHISFYSDGDHTIIYKKPFKRTPQLKVVLISNQTSDVSLKIINQDKLHFEIRVSSPKYPIQIEYEAITGQDHMGAY